MQNDPTQEKEKGCFYYGCLTSVVVAAVLVVVFIFIYQYGKSKITPVVIEFLDKLESGNYAAAYASAGKEWQSIQDINAFTSDMELFCDALGKRQAMSMTGINITGSQAVASYLMKYKGQDTALTATLRKTGGTWQVIGLHWNSQLFTDLMTCPNCKTINDLKAKFCKNCGEPLDPHARLQKGQPDTETVGADVTEDAEPQMQGSTNP